MLGRVEDKNRDGTDSGDAAKTADVDTPMPQVQPGSGPTTSSLGLFGYAVTPINPNPQTARAREIVAQLRGSPMSVLYGGSGGEHVDVQVPSPDLHRLGEDIGLQPSVGIAAEDVADSLVGRSEERRVGKECLL